MRIPAAAKTTSSLGSARIVDGILWRFVGRKPAWLRRAPMPRQSAPAAFRGPRQRTAFIVQYYAAGEDALVPLHPMEVPDAAGALICVDAMPAPVVRAVAFRIESHGTEDETRTIIASRDRRNAG